LVANGDLGPDPATERGTNDQDVAQVLCLEELEVGTGEIADARQPVRSDRPVPARMGRGDRPHRLRQVIGDRGNGERAATAVEVEHRAPGADIGDDDR